MDVFGAKSDENDQVSKEAEFIKRRRQQAWTKDWSGLYETPLEEILKTTLDGVPLWRPKAVWSKA